MTGTRDPDRTITVAVLQAGLDHSQHGNPGPEANWALLSALAREAAAASPDLIAYPEYAISGWPYPPEDELNALAAPVPGDGRWYGRYVSLAREIHVPLLCWLVERDGDKLYNTSFLLDGAGAFTGKYRKVHANLGEQTWWGWSQGQAFAPIEHDGVRYGTSICADMWFPETVRCNELLGADLVIHQSIADDMGHLIPARAFDSELPIVAAIYNGGSYGVDARGELLGKLPASSPGWTAFDLHPYCVRTHRKYGGLWIPKLGNRNLRVVGAYGVLADPATRPPWTDVFLDENGGPQTRDQLLARFSGRYDAHDPALYHAPLVRYDRPWTSPYRVDPEWPHHLINHEGEHLFIVNKTAWTYFACRDPALVLDRARALGANVLRVALEGTPYLSVLGLDMWPWGGSRARPDWGRFSEAYWDQVEERIRLAGERGVGLDVVIYFTLHPTVEQVDEQRLYWEQALRRLGACANVLTWEMANEYTANEAFQDAAGSFFHERDPYRRPVCTSDGTTDDALWPGKPWVDLAVNHTCTSSTERHGLRAWYLAVARNTRAHGKPAFCNESGREVRHGNDDGVHRRKQGWLWCTSGGFWTWHAWDGCEGIHDRDYVAPGQEFIRPMAEFFQSLPFWRLAPVHTALTCAEGDLIFAALAEPDRATVIGYLCTPQTGGHVASLTAGLRLPDGEYRITTLRPADLSVVATQTHVSPGLRQQLPLDLPAFTDDLVLHVERLSSRPRTPIPGTH